MGEPKKRGRPRNSSNPMIVGSDQVIAKTVHRLCLWAFPVRKVCEVVGLVAREVLGRHDSSGQPLGPDRIKQIFDTWYRAENKSRRDRHRWPLRARVRYTKDSLAGTRPTKTLRTLAIEILKNEGESPYRHSSNDELVLTSKLKISDEQRAAIVHRLMQRFGPVANQFQGEFLEQLVTRCFGIAYRAGALGEIPESLKRGN